MQQSIQKTISMQNETQSLSKSTYQMAKEGKIDPLIGREFEVERTIQILCRRRKNNPLLVGEAGVGPAPNDGSQCSRSFLACTAGKGRLRREALGRRDRYDIDRDTPTSATASRSVMLVSPTSAPYSCRSLAPASTGLSLRLSSVESGPGR